MSSEMQPPILGSGAALFPVVGVAAGDLPALLAFFGPAPADAGAAFVVLAQHLPQPTHELAALLGQHTTLSVLPLKAPLRLEPKRIYLVPAGRRLALVDEMIQPWPFERPQQNPIDLFFCALAERYGGRAVAVVLSGAGADGVAGLLHIKERGGLILAGEPRTAASPEMPRAAIASGHVDLVLPAAQMARAILHLREQLRLAIERHEASIAELRAANAELQARNEELGASEERLRLVLENVQEYAIITLDPAGRIISWNAGAAQLFGYAAAEAIGQESGLLYTPEDRAAGVPAHEMQKALEAGRATGERWQMHKDGHRFYARGALTPVRDQAGRLRWFVTVLRDLTAEKQAEQELQAAHVALESRVQERTAALAASNRARQELLRQLVGAQEEERLRIARDLHDQLGQQITGLQLGLKQLEHAAQGSPLAALLPPLEALAQQMAKDTHRLAVNLRPTALDDVGLVPALERLVAEWGAQTNSAAAFHSRGLEHGRLAPTVETALYRVVQEALTNVRRHAAARSVSVLIERHADHVLAIVEDDGVGFDVEAALASGPSQRLGLRGMYERVAQLGGTLEIESAPGSGSTVFVRIPLQLRGRGA